MNYFMSADPFETQNRAHLLTAEERSYMHDTLHYLKACKGRNCTLRRNGQPIGDQFSWNQRSNKKKFDVLGKCHHHWHISRWL